MNWFDKYLEEEGIEKVSEKNKARIKNLAGDLFHAESLILQKNNEFVRENINRHIDWKTKRQRKRDGEFSEKQFRKFKKKVVVITLICFVLIACSIFIIVSLFS